MNWVVFPRYQQRQLWFAVLRCGHSRTVRIEPTRHLVLACMCCSEDILANGLSFAEVQAWCQMKVMP